MCVCVGDFGFLVGRRYTEWIRGYVVDTWYIAQDPYEAPSEANLEGTRRGEEGKTLSRTAREQGGSPLADCAGARHNSREAPGWVIGGGDKRGGLLPAAKATRHHLSAV